MIFGVDECLVIVTMKLQSFRQMVTASATHYELTALEKIYMM